MLYSTRFPRGPEEVDDGNGWITGSGGGENGVSVETRTGCPVVDLRVDVRFRWKRVEGRRIQSGS